MSGVAVTKMHGTFNDFVILDQRIHPGLDLPGFARSVCDRRGGVGADGLIVIAESSSADARMRIINADGSEAEMCGNGMRCAVRYLSERGEGDRFCIETLAGPIDAEIVEKGEAFVVRLQLGAPAVDSGTPLPFPDAVAVSVGNPHVVVFCASLDAFDLTAAGKSMPDRNVHTAVVTGEHSLQVRHYERGAGLTYACGTGAVACAAAAIERGACESPVDVRVPGGMLRVEWSGGGAPAYLSGPAVRVFDAQLAQIHAVPL